MAGLNVYIVTFNCGRKVVHAESVAAYLLSAVPSHVQAPDVIVLCLQEVAPIGYAFLGGSFLTPYFNACRKAVKLAAKDDVYTNIVTRNVGLTAIMVFCREGVASSITSLQTGGVGVGLAEMGNKGAVGVRFKYHDGDNVAELTFVSAHLAPMEDAVERRNEDFKQIVRGLVFGPDRSKPVTRDEQSEDAPLLQGLAPDSDSPSLIYSTTSHLFFAGDLNYRTSLTKPSETDVQRFPQPSKDDTDPRNIKNFLAKDQLLQQVRQGNTLHGLSEAQITFPPTYKYQNTPGPAVTLDSEQQWKWATHRWPSWCDRIYYSATGEEGVKAHEYAALPLFETSDHRPVALCFSIPLTAESGVQLTRSTPFSMNPDWKSSRDGARQKEIIVGLLSYLALTWEGNALVGATMLGAIGGWLIIRSMLVS